MKFLTSRKLAAVVAVLMAAAAIFIGLRAGPVGQTDQFYVADYGQMLQSSTEDYIVAESYALGTRTGARFFVVTVPSTGRMSTEKYFTELAESWELGGSDLLLLLVKNSQDYYFDYGQNWDFALYSQYRELLDTCLEPDFATGDFDAGVVKFYDAAAALIDASAVSASPGAAAAGNYSVDYAYSSHSVGFSGLGFLAVAAVVVLALVFTVSGMYGVNRRYYPYGRRGGYYPPSYFPLHPPRRRPPMPPPPGRRPSPPGSFRGFGSFGGGRSGGSFGGRGGGRSGGGFGGRGGGRR